MCSLCVSCAYVFEDKDFLQLFITMFYIWCVSTLAHSRVGPANFEWPAANRVCRSPSITSAAVCSAAQNHSRYQRAGGKEETFWAKVQEPQGSSCTILFWQVQSAQTTHNIPRISLQAPNLLLGIWHPQYVPRRFLSVHRLTYPPDILGRSNEDMKNILYFRICLDAQNTLNKYNFSNNKHLNQFIL